LDGEWVSFFAFSDLIRISCHLDLAVEDFVLRDDSNIVSILKSFLVNFETTLSEVISPSKKATLQISLSKI